MAISTRIERLSALTLDVGGQVHETHTASVRFFPAAITSGWLREIGATPNGLLDLVVWIALGVQIEPLTGARLAELVSANLARSDDSGRPCVIVTAADLAYAVGRAPDEIEAALARLAERRWLSAQPLAQATNQTPASLVIFFTASLAADVDASPAARPVTADGDPDAVASQVFARFAARRGFKTYAPSAADRRTLSNLCQSGYSLNELLAGIDRAFTRQPRLRQFVQCAPIMQERPPRGNPTNVASDVPPDLAPAIEILRRVNLTVTPDIITRLQLMSGNHDGAARQRGSTGTQWLAEALTLGVGVADDLLKYAAGVMRNWSQQES